MSKLIRAELGVLRAERIARKVRDECLEAIAKMLRNLDEMEDWLPAAMDAEQRMIAPGQLRDASWTANMLKCIAEGRVILATLRQHVSEQD